jgi:hypothetical protein
LTRRLLQINQPARARWGREKTYPYYLLAVIDDGVDIEHLRRSPKTPSESFGPALRSNIWTNPNPDTDLDDRNGYNFYDDDNNPRPRYFRFPYNRMTGNDIHPVR